MKSVKSAAPAKPMRRVIPFRRAHERLDEELAFLPAALEIVETPPSPIGPHDWGNHRPAVLRGAGLGLGGRISAYTLRRTCQGRAEGERADPRLDQGRAEDQASADEQLDAALTGT